MQVAQNINFNKKLAQEIIEEIKEKTSNYYIHIPSSPNQF
jgi:hypothetical protein